MKMAQQTKVHIRWMIRKDMDDVLRIEHQCFSLPWNEGDFILSLRQRNCIGMVASDPNDNMEVWGYMVYELHKTRLNLLNLAVAPEFHRQGVGRQLVGKLTGKLSTQRRTRIDTMVRETNLGAQLFFKEMQFKWVGTVTDYYDESPEDAYQMRYTI